MSYIQFESGREKEKARQELREARAEMLQQAKDRAELRGQRERQKELRGESDWMLPAVAKKLEKPAKKAKKKSSKHKSRSKSKSSKKSRKHHSSSDSDSSSSSSSTSSSSEDEKERKRRKKKSKRSRKASASEDEWVEAPPPPAADKVSDKKAVQRDSWMTSEALLLKTFSRERKEPAKPNEKAQQIDAYDPAKSGRELNPYWKSNGTGLPDFQKPQEDDDDRQAKPQSSSSGQGSSRGWRKPGAKAPSPPRRSRTRSRSVTSSEEEPQEEEEEERTKPTSSCLTDEQINDLAGKAIKAELKGKKELAAELNQQLEVARKERAEFIASGQAAPKANARPGKFKASAEHVLLTKVDQSGNVRPLMQSGSGPGDPNELYGGRRAQKRGSKKVDTHVDGQRVRYFADDDRYDIKQMFEREKHATAAEANLQYADIVSKHKNPNDDLEDIFADKVRKQISAGDAEKRELQSAIREHEKLAASLENCERCFDSAKLDKQLLVSLGDKVYLSLPWYMGLQSGHCILTTLQHVPCCTQLDEDAWEEMSNFRKALTRMFAARRQDVVFYEIANKLHRRPHLSVHCIPIPASQGEMAPFYFKKAIEESEQEWCINKQLVSLRQKSLRAAIPKGLPYVWVHFGMDSGFAHVIEDEDRFPANFAQEILGGMLELNPNAWRKPRKEPNPIGKVKSFAENWKKFDCTQN
ncbi:CWF19-like protein 2 homolog [Drosophila biarmipes]|uniref:CWF19-like protein 2 homolog n=1 Tax=Drosophila biarmipes TaxID=125945 RepID=UPI0007E71AC6|nr:CWF19-like protein 2 homolog [Drosophila biarmipes]